MPSDEQLYHLHKVRGMTYREIAETLELDVNSVRGRVGRERRRLQQPIATLPVSAMYDASARDDTDWKQWRGVIGKLLRLKRMTRVMVWADMHMPDHDPQAMEMAYRIHADFRPDVNVYAGDVFDFDTVSDHFTRQYNRRRVDAFGEVRPLWQAHTQRIARDNPGCVQIAIGGNHDRGRVETFINTNAAIFGDTLTAAYNDLIRASGRVLWPGWVDELRIGPELIEHGERTGKNAARASLEDHGWAQSKTQGHTHQPGEYFNIPHVTAADGVSPFRYIVHSVVAPCLCKRDAHYRSHKQNGRWINGVVLAHVNMHGLDVHKHKVLFHPREDGSLAAVWGNYEYVVRALVRELAA